MIRINDCSENCSKSELDLFNLPPTQTDINSYKYKIIQPQSGWNDSEVINFVLEGTKSYFIDISATELCLKLKVTDGMVVNQKPIYPVNNILHSYFKNIEVKKSGDKSLEKTDDLYAYRAYIEDLLNYDEENKKNYLNLQGFVKDEAGKFDNYNTVKDSDIELTNQITKTGNGTPSDPHKFADFKSTTLAISNYESNSGAHKRRQMLKDGFIFRGKLHLDTFNLNKYLLNGIGLNIELTKSSPSFFVMGDVNEVAEYNIDQIFLRVKYVYVNESLMSFINNNIQSKNAMYPLKRVKLHQFNLTTTHTDHSFEINSVVLPNRIILGFVLSEAIKGSPKTNPYNFENINLSEIEITAGANSVPFDGGIDLSKSVTPAYSTLFNQLKESSCGIDYYDYIGGSYLICFDLTPDQCSFEHFNLLKDGKINIEFSLKSVLSKAYTMITYLEYDKIMQIDKNSTITIT
jgi:hypothetical protein